MTKLRCQELRTFKNIKYLDDLKILGTNDTLDCTRTAGEKAVNYIDSMAVYTVMLYIGKATVTA